MEFCKMSIIIPLSQKGVTMGQKDIISKEILKRVRELNDDVEYK